MSGRPPRAETCSRKHRVSCHEIAQQGAAVTHLFESRASLGVERVLGHEEDDGHVGVDERERAVLELAGEDTLRHQVRELLDLERRLETRRVLVSATHDCFSRRIS